jgi:FkbM family methyltransferase
MNQITTLLRDSRRTLSYLRYSATKLIHGHGAAPLVSRGAVFTTCFSEYMSVMSLQPSDREIAMLRTYLPEARNVFDIGANVGAWSVAMGYINSNACVHAFEPNPTTFRLLQASIRHNNLRQVHAVNLAASECAGTADFQVPPSASVFGRFVPKAAEVYHSNRFIRAATLRVRTERLDSYCAANHIESICFMKLDVEGFELQVLRGLGDMLTGRRIGAIYVETIPSNHLSAGNDFKELTQTLDRAGYGFFDLDSFGQGRGPIRPEDLEAENHLCLPC